MINTERKKKIKIILDILLGLIGFFSLISLIIITGFYIHDSTVNLLRSIINIITIIFVAQEAIRWLLATNYREYFKTRMIEAILVVLLLMHWLFPDLHYFVLGYFGLSLTFVELSILYLSIIALMIIAIIFIKALRYNHLLSKINLTPSSIFALSFAFIIISGALLLMLPKAAPYGRPVSFINALFTSTSAVCVTGLTSIDTAKDYTDFGRFLIMCLIQVGGLGIMTLTTFFAVVLSGGMSYKVRIMMRDLLSEDSLNDVSGLLLKIATYTFVIEFTGALLLYISLGGSFISPDNRDIFAAVFHSVSAFCNAGFSTYSLNLADPALVNNYFFGTVIMLLIIFGGIGFVVISNLNSSVRGLFSKRKLNHILTINSKIVIITTSALLIVGTLIFLLIEPFSYPNNYTFWDKVYHCAFLSVTPRTAGFNTTPTDLLAPGTAIVTIVLMWIGASPGSTGGGIKTTTFAVAVLTLFNQLRGRDKIYIFGRQAAEESISRAFMVIFTSIMFVTLGGIIFVIIEPNKDPLNVFYECFSAMGTVGLSRNLTFYIGDGAKVILILLMYIGRIGTFTFLLAFNKPAAELRYTLPKEMINIG